MHIVRLELENIKSYAAADLEFALGTTAITGNNGAGKTTIIEAIAWVMFDLLDYKKDEFVRRGEKKGSARVTFVSGLDEREYVVFRDTGSAYHVTDPRLNTRIAEKKEEVQRFLWQHLGLEPGTDLRSLFRQAIGVPQGTFTAIFLEGATERKSAFDRLLKVEEYRQASDKLRETGRFIESQISDIREKVAKSEGELARSQTVNAELEQITSRRRELNAELGSVSSDLHLRRAAVATLDSIEQAENSAQKLTAENARVNDRLEVIDKARVEIASLAGKAEKESALSASLDEIRDKLANARAARDNASVLQNRFERLRKEYKANSDKIRDAESRSADAAKLTDLETQHAAIIGSIATLRATLDRDRQFQQQIQNGLCPILSEKCLNLKPGQTLTDFVSDQFTDLNSRITGQESEKAKLAAEIASARDAQKAVAMIDELRKRESELKNEGTRLAEEQKDQLSRSAGVEDLEKQYSELDAELKALGEPRSRIRFLEAETRNEDKLRQELSNTASEIETVKAKLAALFNELRTTGETEMTDTYDRKLHAVRRSDLSNVEIRHAELTANLSSIDELEKKLNAELERFSELRIGIEDGLKERERLDEVAAVTQFIRDTLKEAAPRVAQNYVYHVSIEANQMFRDITGNGEQTLHWKDDYSITLEESGLERPFNSLSGGEQMAAALSVRLGLLKQLSDVRIAFFDEPTTNMDAERRENLASEISKIRHFDQLFVISHDETFDTYVDNVISVDQ